MTIKEDKMKKLQETPKILILEKIKKAIPWYFLLCCSLSAFSVVIINKSNSFETFLKVSLALFMAPFILYLLIVLPIYKIVNIFID